jgi:nitrous oxide reductase accessory protein NosL
MIVSRQIVALILAAFMLVRCDPAPPAEPPKPQEISETSIGHFCGMSLPEHPGPKGQIFVGDRPEPIWFASVRETFAFTMLPEEPKNVAAIYVSDMGKATNWDKPAPGSWIDAKRAYYVIGSRRHGGMEADEAVPFGEAAQAARFAAENGGRVVRFDEMPEDFILPQSDPGATDSPAVSDRAETRKP